MLGVTLQWLDYTSAFMCAVHKKSATTKLNFIHSSDFC